MNGHDDQHNDHQDQHNDHQDQQDHGACTTDLCLRQTESKSTATLPPTPTWIYSKKISASDPHVHHDHHHGHHGHYVHHDHKCNITHSHIQI